MTCFQARHFGATDSTLNTYFEEIRHDDLLTAAEECRLAEAIQGGDETARARMIRANLRLVVKIAREYLGRGLMLDDLIGEGNLGLIEATRRFDPSKGTRFSTYASWWIKQAIRAALITTTATIRLPAHMEGLLNRWRRAVRTLTREFGHAPSDEQVAVSLGLTDGQIALVDRAHRARRLRLESGGGGGDDGLWSPDDVAADAQADAPDTRLEAEDDRRDLLHRINTLEPRERAILSLRYGLDGEEPMTLKEVGRRMGVTREWVRKIEIRAMRKLRDARADEPTAEPAEVARPIPPRRRSSLNSRSLQRQPN